VALFASGHTYFVQRLHERMGLEPFAVHATFQYSGTPGKRHRMRERMLWLAVSTHLPHAHTHDAAPRRILMPNLGNKS
jgi:hypothetical protein